MAIVGLFVMPQSSQMLHRNHCIGSVGGVSATADLLGMLHLQVQFVGEAVCSNGDGNECL